MGKELRDYLDQNFSKLATKEEIKAEVMNLRSEMRTEITDLRSEMKNMEDRVLHQFHITAEFLRNDIKLVAEGVMTLNEKVEREMSQFRKEMAHSHEELKAMIKFPYSELDRHLITLEQDLENLKRRVEKIERSSSAS